MSYVREEGAKPSGLMRVRDVDWANPDINRAGIVPIRREGSHILLGFGIALLASNITPIGGGFENIDYDLLSTAVREFNEEVGHNFHPLVDDAVYNLYAVVSTHNIQILLPVHNWPSSFTATQELEDFIWITPHQLEIMNQRQHYVVPTHIGETRPFLFASSLREIAPMLVDAMKTDIAFNRVVTDEPFERVRKIKTVTIAGVHEGLLEFVHSLNSTKWYHAMIVYDQHNVYISNNYGVRFIIPIHQIIDVIREIGSRKIRLFFLTTQTLQGARRLVPNKYWKYNLIRSIDQALNDMRRTVDDRIINEVLLDYARRIAGVQKSPDRLFLELDIINEFEIKLYEFAAESKSYYNHSRVCYLRMLSAANMLLLHINTGIDFQHLKMEFSDICHDLSSYMALNTMIALNLLYQDPLTALVYIAKV